MRDEETVWRHVGLHLDILHGQGGGGGQAGGGDVAGERDGAAESQHAEVVVHSSRVVVGVPGGAANLHLLFPVSLAGVVLPQHHPANVLPTVGSGENLLVTDQSSATERPEKCVLMRVAA